MIFHPTPADMQKQAFIKLFGGVYEHSPWIAEQAWEKELGPQHDTLETLAELFSGIVENASFRQQMDLICSHPDLAGRAAQAGELTAESSSEQSGAGIDQCNAEEFALFQALNEAYREKFNFPFIMAVKGANRYQILRAFEARLPNDKNHEFRHALDQVHKIAGFRLCDIAQASTQSSCSN